MTKKIFQKKKSAGVTMVEALISIALVSVLTLSVYSVLSSAVKNIGDSKQRTGALALANEKMEIFRNLPYSEIGVVNGIVSGPVEAEEMVNRNGFSYRVICEVRYIDDAFDGFFPEDIIDTDYKRANVQVRWSNGGTEKQITLYNNFVPDGLETNVGGGTLSINTIDYSGQAVAGVNVQIASVEDTPEVNYSSTTDSYGNLILPGVPSQNYRIVLSKEGYETISTYPNPPASAFVPIDPDIFVEVATLNTKTFYLNPSGNLTFSTVRMEDDSSIPGFKLAIRGGRVIGNTPETFVVNETVDLGSDGRITFSPASLGNYWVDNAEELENEGYLYVGTSENYPIILSAGQTKNVSLLFADKNIDSLVVFVSDSGFNYRLEGAEIHLTGEGFDQTIATTQNGSAYFPLVTDPLTTMLPGNYHLEITLDGYITYSENISIDKLTVKNIQLNAN